MSLDSFPVELFHAIISLLEPDDVTASVLALTRALPRSPVPDHALFKGTVRLHNDRRISQLYRRLRQISEDEDGNIIVTIDPVVAQIRELEFDGWDVDAENVLNLAAVLNNLRRVVIKVGARNLTPEHLEKMVSAFKRDTPLLEDITIRFRPYVEKASYLQFHKGSYFDSTLIILSDWPHASLKKLALIQEPPDPTLVAPPGKSFAQPIVFFRLDYSLGPLLACKQINKLCFRLPSRQLSRALTHNSSVTHAHMRVLDLSTANIAEVDIDHIITRFSCLRHLILDGCKQLSTLLGNTAVPGSDSDAWFLMGKRVALGGARRSREYERMINKQLEAEHGKKGNVAPKSDKGSVEAAKPAPKKGRQGVSTATISLRDKGASTSFAPLVPLPFKAAPFTGLIPGPNLKGRKTIVDFVPARTPSPSPPLPVKIRVLPPPPTLQSLCVTIDNPASADIMESWRAGWLAGLEQLRRHRKIILDAWINRHQDASLPVMQFDEGAETWERLDGFTVVNVGEEDFLESYLKGNSKVGGWEAPALCFVGEDGEGHLPGCGHEAWKSGDGIAARVGQS